MCNIVIANKNSMLACAINKCGMYEKNSKKKKCSKELKT
jgi:hypothetical protein